MERHNAGPGIVRSIADEHGFTRKDVGSPATRPSAGNGMRQQDEIDLAFLHRLADTYGAETYVNARDSGDEFVFLAQR